MDNFTAHILIVDDDEGIRTLVKRYLDENKANSTIGFRCAMDRVGSPVGLGAYE